MYNLCVVCVCVCDICVPTETHIYKYFGKQYNKVKTYNYSVLHGFYNMLSSSHVKHFKKSCVLVCVCVCVFVFVYIERYIDLYIDIYVCIYTYI